MGRKSRGPFIAIPRAVLDSPQWANLTGNEAKLLLDIASAYRGGNNGDLACTWSMMVLRGWRSRQTLGDALHGLLQSGFLLLTRQGGRRLPSLYAVTWERIDECDGKLDVAATSAPPNTWTNACKPTKTGKITDPDSVSHQHENRANRHTSSALLTRIPCR
jgi:hypothetical protein